MRRMLARGLALAALAPALVSGSPASAAETIRAGDARFQVLSPTLIRLEYAADGAFEDRPTQTAVDRGGEAGRVTSTVEDGRLVIRTEALTLSYVRGSGPFTERNVEVRLKVGQSETSARPRFESAPLPAPPLDPSTAYQTAQPDLDPAPRTSGNLGGWHRGLDQAVGPVELHDGLLSRDGWYLLDDSRTPLLAGELGVMARPPREGAYQDGYFFGYGHDYPRGLHDLRVLSGPPAFPPRKALGNWFSRYADISADSYRQDFLPAFRRERVPLDVLVIDTNARQPKAWNGSQWQRGLFPDPRGFLDWAHSEGLDVALNVHPSLSSDDPRLAEIEARAGGDLPVATSATATPRCRFFTADPFNTCRFFDWAKPRHVDGYFALHEPFERDGIDFWWLDWCCDESVVSAPGASGDPWINGLYARRSEARGSRWPVLSRIGSSLQSYTRQEAGVWGEHRQSIHFTGDSFDRWEVLDFETRFTASEGNVGVPWVSHDIGSFHGKKLPDDLYARWIQLGAFQPINRLHASSREGLRLPWEYEGKARSTAAAFLRLRARLVPYLYTLGREAYDTGMPLVRSTYLAYPEHDGAYQHDRQYLLGDSLLVAPVGTPGDPATKRVWFPPGAWTDFFTGEVHRGPAVKDLSVPLERMPLFVRAGGIVPLGPLAKAAGNASPDTIELRVQAGADGRFELYEDEGEGLAYRQGAFSRTPISFRDGHGLTIGRVRGTFPGQPSRRSYEVQFAGLDLPAGVTLNGRQLPRRALSYSPDERVLRVRTPRLPTGRPARLRFERCLARRKAFGRRGLPGVRTGTRGSRLVRAHRTGRTARLCVSRGGRVVAVLNRRGRVRTVVSTAPGHRYRRIGPGARATRLRRSFPRRRGPGSGLVAPRGDSRLVMGIRRGRVRFIAATRSKRSLKSDLRRAGVRRRSGR